MTEVVAALIWDNDKFMICQRPVHKSRGLLWEFVGGKVEPGETKEQALIRECREELAITLDVGNTFMDVVHELFGSVGRSWPLLWMWAIHLWTWSMNIRI